MLSAEYIGLLGMKQREGKMGAWINLEQFGREADIPRNAALE